MTSLISSLLHCFTRVDSRKRNRFNDYLCRKADNSELSETSKLELIEKIVKKLKDINYFCNNLLPRCLTGFKHISEEY